MPWILMLLAAACFLVPYFTTSVGLGALCLVLALVFFVAGLMSLLSSRIGDSTRSDAQILGPDEIRALRERAEAQRKAAEQTDPSSPPSGVPPA